MLKSDMRFKYKLLLSLSIITIWSLGAFLWVAFEVMTKDRVNQAFETTSSLVSRDRDRLELTMQFLISQVQLLARQYNPVSKSFLPAAQEIFQNSLLSRYEIWSKSKDKMVRTGILSKSIEDAQGVGELLQDRLVKLNFGESTVQWWMSPEGTSAIGSVSLENGILAVFEIPVRWLQNLEDDASRATSLVYILNSRELLSYGRERVSSLDTQKRVVNELSQTDVSHDRVSRIAIGKDEFVFAARAASVVYGLGVVSIIPESELLLSWHFLVRRFTYLGGFTACIAVLVGLVLSRRLTSSLTELTNATGRLAKGQFDIELRLGDKDEVGALKQSFFNMSREIFRLMGEMAAKGRMETELKTAQAVQETLFPPTTQNFSGVEVSGMYESASECGGDFWTTWENEKHVYVFLGDITGHGAPAALLTSAARAVLSILESIEDITVEQIAFQMNKALHDTSKGKRMMTAMILRVDRATGTVTCLNSSHVPMVRFGSKVPSKMNWKDTEVIEAPVNPRLGESQEGEWVGHSFELHPGESLVILTDGLADVENEEKKPWGDRKLYTQLIRGWQNCHSTDAHETLIKQVFTAAREYANGMDLPDDMTMVIVTRDRAARTWEDELGSGAESKEAG